MVILALYCLAGMIRLAYYNVLEEKKNNDDDDAEVIEQPDGRKYFHGMPITAISVGLPIIYVTSPLLGSSFPILLHGIMILAMIRYKCIGAMKNKRYRSNLAILDIQKR